LRALMAVPPTHREVPSLPHHCLARPWLAPGVRWDRRWCACVDPRVGASGPSDASCPYVASRGSCASGPVVSSRVGACRVGCPCGAVDGTGGAYAVPPLSALPRPSLRRRRSLHSSVPTVRALRVRGVMTSGGLQWRSPRVWRSVPLRRHKASLAAWPRAAGSGGRHRASAKGVAALRCLRHRWQRWWCAPHRTALCPSDDETVNRVWVRRTRGRVCLPLWCAWRTARRVCTCAAVRVVASALVLWLRWSRVGECARVMVTTRQ
jgi:hypothetical protein